MSIVASTRIFGSIALLATVVHPLKFPSYLMLNDCDPLADDYSPCKYENFWKILNKGFDGGIPELNLTAFDPYVLPYARVDHDFVGNALRLHADVRNLTIYGSHNLVVQKFSIDGRKLRGVIQILFPKNTIEMEYDARGRIMSVPLRNSGFFGGNFTNIKLQLRGSLEEHYKGDVRYLRIRELKVSTRLGDGRIGMTSNDPRQQFVADLIVQFYNSNPRFVNDAINPALESASIDVYERLFAPILDQIPAADLLA